MVELIQSICCFLTFDLYKITQAKMKINSDVAVRTLVLQVKWTITCCFLTFDLYKITQVQIKCNSDFYLCATTISAFEKRQNLGLHFAICGPPNRFKFFSNYGKRLSPAQPLFVEKSSIRSFSLLLSGHRSSHTHT